MRHSSPIVRVSLIAVLAGLCGALAAAQTTQEPFKPMEFRGRWFTGAGGSMDAVLTVRIDVTGFTTTDEVVRLSDAINARGESGFREVFRSFKKGVIRVIGGTGLNIEFHAAKEVSKDKSTEIHLIAENAVFQPGSSRAPGQGLFFLVIVLELDAKGNGEGKVYENSTIKFTPNGELELDEFKTAPKLIGGLRRTK